MKGIDVLFVFVFQDWMMCDFDFVFEDLDVLGVVLDFQCLLVGCVWCVVVIFVY